MKAEDLSLSTIIIAVLCLIVLAVIVYIFIGRTSNFEQSVRTCAGVCAENADSCPEDYPVAVGMNNCKSGETTGGATCCLKI